MSTAMCYISTTFIISHKMFTININKLSYMLDFQQQGEEINWRQAAPDVTFKKMESRSLLDTSLPKLTMQVLAPFKSS